MIWKKKDISSQRVADLSQHFGLDKLTASILLRRKIESPMDLCFFLEEDIRFLHNPFLFKDMDILIDRLYQAVEEEEKVLVFGDRDVDGITSTVILVEALQEMGLQPEWRVPIGDENYGLSMEAVETWAEQEGTLIITVDNGITCHKEIERASELGIHVIVLDHHEPQQSGRPPALAVVDPKLKDETYPFRDLAGCGVASRVLWALALSKSSIYNQTFVLLHAEQEGEDWTIQAMSMTNLVPGERLSFPLSRGAEMRDRLLEFLQGRPLMVYRQDQVLPVLQQIFGTHAEIALQELAPELAALSAQFKDKSLKELAAKSRTRRYGLEEGSGVSMLASLFTTLLYRKENTLFQSWMKSLDLVALGTIADMMPLCNENRILLKKGLEQLNRTERKPLREVLIRQKMLGKQVSVKDISWYISPWFNSAGRMKKADRAVTFLLEQDDQQIFQLAEEISALNRERREMGDRVWQQHLTEAENSRKGFEEKLLMVVSEDIPRGITGFLATRYLQYFSLPSVVICQQGDLLSGSIRGPKSFPIQDYIGSLSSLLDDWGGHEFAAGFSMPKENYEAFRRKTRQFLEQWKDTGEIEEPLWIDAELPHSYLNEDLLPLVQNLQPYGEGFPPLTFCARNVLLEKVDLVGKDASHLKLLLKTDENVKWPSLMWNSVDRYRKDFRLEERVDVLFHLEENFFRNQRTLQWNVIDIKRSSPVED